MTLRKKVLAVEREKKKQDEHWHRLSFDTKWGQAAQEERPANNKMTPHQNSLIRQMLSTGHFTNSYITKQTGVNGRALDLISKQMGLGWKL